jgi:hypothetical protein
MKRKGQKNSEDMRLKGNKTKNKKQKKTTTRTGRGGSHKPETTRRSESEIRNKKCFLFK